MNEIEKAIKWLKGECKSGEVTREQAYSYVDSAISSLEKQIAKIPDDTWENDIERRRHHLCRWACPNCGTFLGFENKHCTECGTKIKWDAIA